MTIKSQKLFTLALMFMGGMKPRAMAKKLNMPYRTVLTHVKSELFRAQLVELQRTVSTDVIEGIMRRIDEEALPALQVLSSEIHRDIRKTDPKTAPLIAQKRAAAQFLLGDLFMDRRVPRLGGGGKKDGEADGAGIKVSISEDALREMFQALAEFRGENVNVQFARPPVLVNPPEPAPSSPHPRVKKQKALPPPVEIEEVDALVKELQELEAE